MFQTELREVFAVMNLRRNKRQLYEVLLRDPSYRTLDAETVKEMSVILNAPRLWSERKRYINRNENKEGYDMCQAMRELLADAAAAGKEQGISQGISQGAADKTRIVVTNMLARGMSDDDICAIAECNSEFIQTVRMKTGF